MGHRDQGREQHGQVEANVTALCVELLGLPQRAPGARTWFPSCGTILCAACGGGGICALLQNVSVDSEEVQQTVSKSSSLSGEKAWKCGWIIFWRFRRLPSSTSVR